AEYIELEKVVVDRVEVEMRRFPLCCSIICRILYRREIVYIHVIRNNDDSARMLSRRPFDTRAAQYKPVDFGTSPLQSIIVQIAFDITECRLLGGSADCAGAEHLVLTEQHFCIVVCLRLIVTAEVEVDIRHFVTFEAQE